METVVKIFVAGPSGDTLFRNIVRAIATEISTEYHECGHKISIDVKSCDDSGQRRQEKYDDYIKSEANMVLFVLEGSMEKVTRDEYNLAASQYTLYRKPVFYVFLKKYEEKTPEIKIIEDIMKEPDQVYYTLYADNDDLRVKIKDEVENYVNKLIADKVMSKLEQTKQTIIKQDVDINEKQEQIVKLKKIIGNHWKIALCTSILALGVLGLGLYRYFNPKPMLLFAGGGSVVNFIQSPQANIDKVNIRNYPNSVYVNMASGNAWSLLVEDAYINGEKPFYPVCLSADSIGKSFVESIKKQGYIIGLRLGSDPLVVYIDSLCAQKWGYGFGSKSKITTKELNNKINEICKNKNIKIFTTSANSGTLRSYQSIINVARLDSMLEKRESIIFFDSSEESYINKHIKDDKNTVYPYIILGSEYYSVAGLKNKNLSSLYVVDDDSIKKPMFIYFFVKSKVPKQTDKWIVEPQIIDFLKSLFAKSHDDIKQWDSIVKEGFVTIVDPNQYVYYIK